MESVSSLKRKCKKEKVLSCIYLLDKCKGFSSFLCVNPVKVKFSLSWFTVNIWFISHSVSGCLIKLCDLPCLCELCVCARANVKSAMLVDFH